MIPARIEPATLHAGLYGLVAFDQVQGNAAQTRVVFGPVALASAALDFI